jgi:hypothetical protein
MPPRYAYWTILIDQKPTAFRAREREELLPTFHQLQRKNSSAVMKWYARGRLWDSPEEERAAQRAPRPPQEKRRADWRPGGTHQDPRDRFRRKRQSDKPARPAQDFRPPRKPWQRDANEPSKPQGAQGFRPPGKPWQRDANKPNRPQGAQGFRPPSKPWQRDANKPSKPWQPKPDRSQAPRGASRKGTETPPPRVPESPSSPPQPERIVVKPKPPERG